MQIDCAALLSLLSLIERDARNARELFVVGQAQRQQAAANRIVAGRFANGGLVAAGPSPEQMAHTAANIEAQASACTRSVMANAQAMHSLLSGGERAETDTDGLVAE